MNQVKLVVVGGATQATELMIRPPVVLGRGHEASIPLPHPLVSRLHCEIVLQQGRLLVRDLGSLNGTFVGNHRVSEAELPPGELLTVGSVTFRAEYEVDTDLLPPAQNLDVAQREVSDTAEDSQLSVSELPVVFDGQSETDDHPLSRLEPADPSEQEAVASQEEFPPLATVLEPESNGSVVRGATEDSQLSISDIPMAFNSPSEVNATPLDGSDAPVQDDVPLASPVESAAVAEVEKAGLDEDTTSHQSMSGEETRDVDASRMEDGEATADVSRAVMPSARPDSLDFSVASDLDGSDSGTQPSKASYDSALDEDLKRFLKDLD